MGSKETPSEPEKSVTAAAELISHLQLNHVEKIEVGASKRDPTGESVGGGGDKDAMDDSSVPEEPSPPPQNKKPLVSHVLVQLEQLIVSDEWTQQNKAQTQQGAQTAQGQKKKKLAIPKLNELGRSIVTCYSLKAYIDLLGPQHRQSIATWLYGNTSQALSNLFKFSNSSVHFHDDALRGGILHVGKLALRSRYPKIAQEGFHAFSESPPVAYISPALHYDISQYLAVELGISDVVTVGKIAGGMSNVEGRLDHTSLETRLKSDTEAGRRPVLVVAVVGSAIFGQNDLVSKLLELREEYGFWLHVVGQGTAALALKEPPEHLLKVLQSVDSFTVSLGQWIGVNAVPSVTLFRPPEDWRAMYREKLDSLPWWVVTQHLTPPKMTDNIDYAYRLSKSVLKGLLRFSQMEVLGLTNPQEYRERMETGKLLPPTVVVFKYRPLPKAQTGVKEGERAVEEKDGSLEQEYQDCLNAWLGQGLIGECPFMGLHLVELGGSLGTAIRYSALESAALYGTESEQVPAFLKQLEDTLSIVDATVEAKRKLPALIESHNDTLVEIAVQKWAGVGAVSFVPTIVRDTPMSKWNEKQRQTVSYLNIELVHSLRSSDSAFSIGGNGEHVACVKFGMLADERDLEDLIGMVAEKGKQIEESSQYLESLAEMVRQGIEAANVDLRKENEERLMQEGALRQMPLVGSLLNWWSPLSQESTNIKGRAFDLKTGRIHSTDVIYKHKLQIKMDEGEAGNESSLDPVTPISTPQVPHGFAQEESQPTEEEDSKGKENSEDDSAPGGTNEDAK